MPGNPTLSPAESEGGGAIGPAGPVDPVFREPWEAQAFAMTLLLEARGAFSSTEWAQALGAEIRQAQQAGDPDSGETYYRHWLAALERLVTAKGIASPAALLQARHAWSRAAARTPPGRPMTVSARDLDGV
jgi:nitrile hydratase accessory protein